MDPHCVDNRLLLSLVVPVFNEEDGIDAFLVCVNQVFAGQDDVHLEFVFVNDGSTDNTIERLLERQGRDKRIRVVDLSRHFGKEAALTAGLHAARGRVVVPLDVDLQDPPEVIPEMLARWREGYEVVLGRRVNRAADSWAKRTFAGLFYRLHNAVADTKLPENIGDFRLMDRKVVDALGGMSESRRFMKGLFAWAGFRTVCVDYERPKRAAGQTKFNGWRLWNFAIEGITSFSTVPLRIWTYIGFTISLMSFIFTIFIIVKTLIFGRDTPGYASLMVAIMFFGGLQLMGIGMLGEYLGRTYIESKRRPVYLVRRIYEGEDAQTVP